jgi:hypothetical protein
MHRHVALLSLLFACAAISHAAQFGKSDTKVEASVSATKPDKDGKQTVTITLEVAKEWYLYANPTNHNEAAEQVAPNRTHVAFKSKGKVDAKVKYPAGKVKTEIVGKEKLRFNIYQDKVTITADVQRGANSGDLEAIIEVNACRINEKGMTATCLEQGKIVLKVP